MSQSDKKSSFKDALSFLQHDHDTVKALFEEFEKSGEKAFAKKKKLAEEICFELTVHTTLEEELFYPQVEKEIKELEGLLKEASVEHKSAKALIAEIQEMAAEDSLFNAKVKVLSEQISHHVQEEEEEMFPKVRSSNMDITKLLDKLVIRKENLTAKVV